MDLGNDLIGDFGGEIKQNLSRQRFLSVEIDNTSNKSNILPSKTMVITNTHLQSNHFVIKENSASSLSDLELYQVDPSIKDFHIISNSGLVSKSPGNDNLSVFVDSYNDYKKDYSTENKDKNSSFNISAPTSSSIVKNQTLEVCINDSSDTNANLITSLHNIAPVPTENIEVFSNSLGSYKKEDQILIDPKFKGAYTEYELIDESILYSGNNFSLKESNNISEDLYSSNYQSAEDLENLSSKKSSSEFFVLKNLNLDILSVSDSEMEISENSLDSNVFLNKKKSATSPLKNRIETSDNHKASSNSPKKNLSCTVDRLNSLDSEKDLFGIVDFDYSNLSISETVNGTALTENGETLTTPKKKKEEKEALRIILFGTQLLYYTDSEISDKTKVESDSLHENVTLDPQTRNEAEHTISAAESQFLSPNPPSECVPRVKRKKSKVISYKYTLRGPVFPTIINQKNEDLSPALIRNQSTKKSQCNSLIDESQKNISTKERSKLNMLNNKNSTAPNFSNPEEKTHQKNFPFSKNANNTKFVEKPREERDWKEFYPNLSLKKKIKIVCSDQFSDNPILNLPNDQINFLESPKISKKRKLFDSLIEASDSTNILSTKKPIDFLPKSQFKILVQDPPPEGILRSEAHLIQYSGDIDIRDLETIEYDLDDMDFQWLKILNKDISDEKIKLRENLMETIIFLLEKEWHQLTHDTLSQISQEKLPYLCSEDAACVICEEEECDNSNAIVFCDGCNIAVHQDCYGVPYIPEGQWLCRLCMLCPGMEASCIFCPQLGGAFKKTSDNMWAHLLCALWIPEVGISNTVYMEPIDSVESIPKSRWKLTCSFCNLKVGACIQCSNKHCFTAFHVTCARKARIYMKMGVDPVSKDPIFNAFCCRHTPRNYDKEIDIHAPLRALGLSVSISSSTQPKSISLSRSKSFEESKKTYSGLNSKNSSVKLRKRGRPKRKGAESQDINSNLISSSNVIPTDVNVATTIDLKFHEERHLDSSASKDSSVFVNEDDQSARFTVGINEDQKSCNSKSLTSTLLIFDPENPIINSYIFNKVLNYLHKGKFLFGFQKFKNHWSNVLRKVCRYWALKRSHRNGRPLIKKLHFDSWPQPIPNTNSDQSFESNKAKLVSIHSELCKLRDILKDVILREKLKLGISNNTSLIISKIFYPLKETYLSVLSYFLSADKNGVFSTPVNDEVAPLYSAIIKDPMDLSVIWRKVNGFSYLTPQDFEKDLRLIWKNCKQYNSPKSRLYRTANNFNNITYEFMRQVEESCDLLNIDKHEYSPLYLGSENLNLKGVTESALGLGICNLNNFENGCEAKFDSISKNILDFKLTNLWKNLILGSLSNSIEGGITVPDRKKVSSEIFLALNPESGLIKPSKLVDNHDSPDVLLNDSSDDMRNKEEKKLEGISHNSPDSLTRLSDIQPLKNLTIRTLIIPDKSIEPSNTTVLDTRFVPHIKLKTNLIQPCANKYLEEPVDESIIRVSDNLNLLNSKDSPIILPHGSKKKDLDNFNEKISDIFNTNKTKELVNESNEILIDLNGLKVENVCNKPPQTEIQPCKQSDVSRQLAKNRVSYREIKLLFSTPAILSNKEKSEDPSLLNFENESSRTFKESIVNLIETNSPHEVIESSLETFVNSLPDPNVSSLAIVGGRTLRSRSSDKSSCQSLSDDRSNNFKIPETNGKGSLVHSRGKKGIKNVSKNNLSSPDKSIKGVVFRNGTKSTINAYEKNIVPLKRKKKSSAEIDFNLRSVKMNKNSPKNYRINGGPHKAHYVDFDHEKKSNAIRPKNINLITHYFSGRKSLIQSYRPKLRRIDGKLKIPDDSPAIFDIHHTKWKVGYPVWAAMGSFPWFPAEIYDPSKPGIPEEVNDDRRDPERNCILVYFYDVTLPNRTWKWLAPYRVLRLGADIEVDKNLLRAAEKRSKTAKEQVYAAYKQVCKDNNFPIDILK
ncbi:Peregrin [Smittium mucronatum]|uniref:Peregrin n=1 Tax=Smittium mucronatum TaxID=133383 RepID=A0A1R0H4Z2_9FUNG|nr:Peregrin [Smittium mucronatum]